jgi:hypothetical protein
MKNTHTPHTTHNTHTERTLEGIEKERYLYEQWKKINVDIEHLKKHSLMRRTTEVEEIHAE